MFIKPTWSYLQNVFDNATKGTSLRMYQLSNDHFDKLRGRINKIDAKIATLSEPNEALEKERNTLKSLLLLGEDAFKAFREQYRTNTTTNARYRLLTERLNVLLRDLVTKARRWDAMVQVEFDITTPDYIFLFPQGRSIFQTAPYDVRINEVQSFAERLADYPALSDLLDAVRLFGEKLYSTRQQQQDIEGSQQENSKLLEEKRLALASKMHGMYGGLLMQYHETPIKVETFYELQYLRRAANDSDSDMDEQPRETAMIVLTPNEIHTALEGKLAENDIIRIVNTGAANFRAYLASAADGVRSSAVMVDVGQMVTMTAGHTDTIVLIENEEDRAGEALVELL